MKRVMAFSLLLLILLPGLAITENTYVGSKKCLSCHRSIYEMWKDTLHNKSQQLLSRTNDTLVVDWRGMIKLKAGNIPEVIVKLEDGPGDVHQATLVDAKDPSKEVTYTVVRTYGGWGWKTAASAEAGDIHNHDFRMIRPQVSLEMFEKDPRNVVPNSCNGCHSEWGKDKAGYEAGAKAYDSLFVR